MDISNIVIGVLALLVTIVGVFYTYKAYHKSSSTHVVKGNDVNGDIVMGDKFGGDKVEGNKTVHNGKNDVWYCQRW